MHTHQRSVNLETTGCIIAHAVVEGIYFNAVLGDFVMGKQNASIHRGKKERMDTLAMIHAKYPESKNKPHLIIFEYLV